MKKQFSTIGLTQTLNRFVAQKANRFSFNHDNHPIALYVEDTKDESTNPQNFFFIIRICICN